MEFQYNDGGRKAAGYKRNTTDCGTRAIAIALELPYQEVYDAITKIVRGRLGKRERRIKYASGGTYRRHVRSFLEPLGWVFRDFPIGELPTFADFQGPERCIILTKRHYFACIQGVRHDTHQKARTGTVIGYWSKPDAQT